VAGCTKGKVWWHGKAVQKRRIWSTTGSLPGNARSIIRNETISKWTKICCVFCTEVDQGVPSGQCDTHYTMNGMRMISPQHKIGQIFNRTDVLYCSLDSFCLKTIHALVTHPLLPLMTILDHFFRRWIHPTFHKPWNDFFEGDFSSNKKMHISRILPQYLSISAWREPSDISRLGATSWISRSTCSRNSFPSWEWDGRLPQKIRDSNIL